MTVILPGGLGQIYAAAGGSTFDPAFVPTAGTAPTFSNNNKTVTWVGASGYDFNPVRGKKSNTTGLKYFEMISVNANTAGTATYNSCGLCNGNWNANASNYGVGGDADSMGMQQDPLGTNATGQNVWEGWQNNGATGTWGPAPANGQTVGFHCNLTNGYIYVSINGTYLIGNPGSTANAMFSAFATGTAYYPCVVLGYGGSPNCIWTIKTGSPFTYAMYTGYTAWG